MNIVTVLPIKKAIGIDTLTYFSDENPEIGSLVEIPLRKKKAMALVTEVKDVRKNKMLLKNSDYTLRKMSTVAVKPCIPSWFIKVAREAADYFGSTTGAVLFSLLHKHIIELGIPSIAKDAHWHICPTTEIAKAYFEKYPNKDSVLLFTADMTKGKYKQSLKKSEFVVRDVFITSSFVSLIPKDAKKIIIEDSLSRWHKNRTRPFVDLRTFTTMVGKRLGIEIEHKDILNQEVHRKNKITIVSKKKNNKDINVVSKFSIFDTEIEEKIKRVIKDKKRVFVYALRKGHSPIVLCGHCGKTVKCEKCDSPVVLYKSKENYFLCHHCGTKRSALEKCKACDSWKLESLGIGIEKIQEEIERKWGSGLIEVGTEKSLDTLSEYALSIIPSLDSLLSIPDFAIDEKIMRVVLTLNEHTDGELVIGTKYDKLPLLEFIKDLDTKKFIMDQNDKKRKYGYPPYKTLIKITLRGNKEKIAKQEQNLKVILKRYSPTTFPAFIKSIKNEFILHILIKVDTAVWPDDELVPILRTLPPWIEVNVNPESLL